MVINTLSEIVENGTNVEQKLKDELEQYKEDNLRVELQNELFNLSKVKSSEMI